MFSFLLPQEILDQIAEVDLVLNLKTKKTGPASGFYSPSREFFRMGRSRFNLTLQSQNGPLKSACGIDNFWKEKLRLYEEQVLSFCYEPFCFFSIYNCCWHALIWFIIFIMHETLSESD